MFVILECRVGLWRSLEKVKTPYIPMLMMRLLKQNKYKKCRRQTKEQKENHARTSPTDQSIHAEMDHGETKHGNKQQETSDSFPKRPTQGLLLKVRIFADAKPIGSYDNRNHS